MTTLPDKERRIWRVSSAVWDRGEIRKNSTDRGEMQTFAAQSVNYGNEKWDDNISGEYVLMN